MMFQTTVPYNPIAERMNNILCESGRSMLSDADMPTTYWGEAIMSACYLQNYLPGTATKNSPYKPWNRKMPDLKHIKMSESKSYIHVPEENGNFLLGRYICQLNESQKSYRILHLDINKVTIGRSLIINDTHMCQEPEDVSQSAPPECQPEQQTPSGKEMEHH